MIRRTTSEKVGEVAPAMPAPAPTEVVAELQTGSAPTPVWPAAAPASKVPAFDVTKVRLELPPGVTESDLGMSRAALVVRTLQAHEHALKNKALGNLSGRQVAANLLLGDGTWGLATNIENSRDVGVLCGERSAIVTAFNNALVRYPLEQLQDPTKAAELKQKLKVRLLLMSDSTSACRTDPVSPCAECQDWLATDRYFSPDTLLGALKRADDGEVVLTFRRVRDFLPVHTSQQAGTVSGDASALPIEVSAAARCIMGQKGIGEQGLRAVMQQAMNAQRTSRTAEYCGHASAAATLFSTGETFVAPRLDWTARWFEAPDLASAAHGITVLKGRGQPSQIAALAYYGSMPSVRALGVLAQPTRGGPDTLIATVEAGALKIRTIRDFMTDIYVSSTSVKS